VNEIRKKDSQPANTGRVWYAYRRVRYDQGYKIVDTPSAKLFSPPSSQPSRLSSTIIGDFVFPP